MCIVRVRFGVTWDIVDIKVILLDSCRCLSHVFVVCLQEICKKIHHCQICWGLVKRKPRTNVGVVGALVCHFWDTILVGERNQNRINFAFVGRYGLFIWTMVVILDQIGQESFVLEQSAVRAILHGIFWFPIACATTWCCWSVNRLLESFISLGVMIVSWKYCWAKMTDFCVRQVIMEQIIICPNHTKFDENRTWLMVCVHVWWVTIVCYYHMIVDTLLLLLNFAKRLVFLSSCIWLSKKWIS